MNNLEKFHHAHWRPNLQEEGPGDTTAKTERLLLLLDKEGNRQRLQEHLSNKYNLVEPVNRTLLNLEFDLVIIDAGCFHKWHNQLLEVKSRVEPTFLPVILLISRAELKAHLNPYWGVADEFIITPVDRVEFSERVNMLLKARNMSLAQRDKLAYLATYDRATGLPNKHLFMEQLSKYIVDASVMDYQLQVVIVHLPLAKIMHSLGNHDLDQAAVESSSRLQAVFGAKGLIAKLATEEWGIIYRSENGLETCFDACHRLKKVFDKPLNLNGERVLVSARIGIAVYPNDAADATAILNCAMNALSEAKVSKPRFYSRADQYNALRFIRTEAKLHEAIERRQFELWYQPQLRLSDSRVTGVEALIRWRLPSGELVPPDDFIPIAESTGMIADIDRWVIEEACRTMVTWRERGLSLNRIAVNISPVDLQQADFADFIQGVLEKYHLPPPTLELELTEFALFESSDEILEKLNRLRDYGMDIAVDDFGTGYSSLGYLHRLPITLLKIDKSFIDNITRNKTNAAITQTIVWLAKNFNLKTIAEGIETQEQADYLASIEVDIGQGYFYSRPMPEEKLRNWLQNKSDNLLIFNRNSIDQ